MWGSIETWITAIYIFSDSRILKDHYPKWNKSSEIWSSDNFMKVQHIWDKSQRGRVDVCRMRYKSWKYLEYEGGESSRCTACQEGWYWWFFLHGRWVWFGRLDNMEGKSWSSLSPNSSSEIDESFVCQFGLIANNQSYPPSWVSTLWFCLDSCRFMISDGFGNNASFEVLTHIVNEFLWLV